MVYWLRFAYLFSKLYSFAQRSSHQQPGIWIKLRGSEVESRELNTATNENRLSSGAPSQCLIKTKEISSPPVGLNLDTLRRGIRTRFFSFETMHRCIAFKLNPFWDTKNNGIHLGYISGTDGSGNTVKKENAFASTIRCLLLC